MNAASTTPRDRLEQLSGVLTEWRPCQTWSRNVGLVDPGVARDGVPKRAVAQPPVLERRRGGRRLPSGCGFRARSSDRNLETAVRAQTVAEGAAQGFRSLPPENARAVIAALRRLGVALRSSPRPAREPASSPVAARASASRSPPIRKRSIRSSRTPTRPASSSSSRGWPSSRSSTSMRAAGPFRCCSARIPTVANGDLSRDGRTIVYHLRRGVRWQDGVPVTAADVLFTLRAIVDPRNPIRSREGYDRIARAERIDDRPCASCSRHPGRRRSRRCSATAPRRSTCLPAHLLGRTSARSTARPSVPRRSATAPTASSRGSAASVSSTWRTRATGAARRRPRGSTSAIIPDPGDELHLAAERRARLEFALARASSKRCWARTGIRVSSTFRWRWSPGSRSTPRTRRSTTCACAARSPPRSTGKAISDKITFKRYPVVDTAQPLGSWARDPACTCRPTIRPPRTSLLDAAGWRRGPDGVRAKDGRRLALTYVRVSRKPDRRARGGVHRARAARPRASTDAEVGHEREAVLAEVARRRAGVGRVRSGVRSVADGRRSGRQLSLDLRRRRPT